MSENELNVNEPNSGCQLSFRWEMAYLQVCGVFFKFICFGDNDIILQGGNGSDSMQGSTILSVG